MSDRPEIPQDLARKALEAWGVYLHTLDRKPDIDVDVLESERLQRALADGNRAWNEYTKLDALEQPPDPAEVAVTQYFDCVDGTAVCPEDHCGGSRRHLTYHFRQAYVERDKAVKKLGVAVNAFLYGDGSQRFPQEFRIDLVNTYARVLELYPEWYKETKNG